MSGAAQNPTSFFLGVQCSLSGLQWRERPHDNRIALTLSQRLDLPEIIGRVIAGRGIGLEAATDYLHPTLRGTMPDPRGLKDMEAGAGRLAEAIMGGENIAVFGDFDVDGATSSALLTRYLRAAGGRVDIYIPDRLTEGYGPNTPALEKLKSGGAAVVVTVDCGTTSHAPLADARALGLDVVVIDHHEPEPLLPDVLALINPKRLDEDGSLAHLAAVGLTFLLAVATNRTLREAGWFAGRPEPDLLSLLDLVALGTVCDVVPLLGLNRAFVNQGLKVLARRQNLGLAALCDVAGIDRTPEAYHLGYVLGPRVNAGGRVGQSWLGARLLSSDAPDDAWAMAERLDTHNKERQEIERGVLDDALARLANEADPHAIVTVAGEGWHPGVIGIVANRIVDRYNLPACVMAINGDEVVGSGRSIPGVDLGAAILAARQAGLLTRGGGHVMAAGFSLPKAGIPAFTEFLEDRIGKHLADSPIAPQLTLDGAVSVKGASRELIEALQQLSPFGPGNAEPKFAIPSVQIKRPSVVGDGHVRGFLTDDGGGSLPMIAFRAMESDIGPALLSAKKSPLHVAGRLRINHWQGRETLQMQVDDVAAPRP
ncbi:MAG: single-stranded-DNA-specific exonuclease RecJ [Magnetospiraceae bacterium]